MIRVVHVLWKAEFGGIERLVLDLASVQAADSEIQVGILFGNSVGQFMSAFVKSGARLHSAETDKGYDFSPRKILRVRRMLQEYDVIHAHTFVAPLALALISSRRKIVYTEHGNFGFGRKRTLADAAKRPFFHLFIKHWVNHLTFNSSFTRAVWEQRSCPKKFASSVVPNGIDFENGNPAAVRPASDLAAWAQGSFIVGTCSRFAGFKRIDRLIEGFARFHVGRDAKLLLVGDGPLRSGLERKVSELGLSDRTLFTGFRSDVRACQAAMDVSVFPSQSEPFGLVCVETLALGKPTIVFADGGGMADIVRPLWPEDVVEDVSHLSQRLAYYYENPAKRDAASEQRRAHARGFDIRHTATQFRKVYRSLLDSPALEMKSYIGGILK